MSTVIKQSATLGEPEDRLDQLKRNLRAMPSFRRQRRWHLEHRRAAPASARRTGPAPQADRTRPLSRLPRATAADRAVVATELTAPPPAANARSVRTGFPASRAAS